MLQNHPEPRRFTPDDDVTCSPDANTRQSHPEAADDGGRPPLQVVPPPVPLLNHLLQPAGCVRPVLPGQPAVLFVHQLQLSQALMDLPLERLPEPQNIRRQTREGPPAQPVRFSSQSDQFQASMSGAGAPACLANIPLGSPRLSRY